ncbi:phage tail assembly protein [Bartonella grahamii]|uniref:phage tail assembly protein n=1 Tax=Bartonella grahamii TaxID=33045 RepID=UPI002E7AED89|nr:phage tail assembly protein [Bartonella grahamii]
MNITELATYQLLVPIKVEGKTYTEITLRRPKFKDLKAIQSKEGDEQSIEMIACLSGWSYNAISKLDIRDFLNIKDIYGPLIKKVLKKLDKMNTIIKIPSLKIPSLKTPSLKTPSLKILSLETQFSKHLKNFINKVNAPIKSVMDECILIDSHPKKHTSNLHTNTFETETMATANAKVKTCSTYEPITVHNPTVIKGEHMTFTKCSFLVQDGPSNQIYLSNQSALTSHKKPACETKKQPLERISKLLDIVSKIFNFPLWFWEFLLKELRKFF